MDELRALRWYEGDVTGNDPLWADSKAYVTLNAIFFDGIENEMIKAKENKHLNPALLSRWQEVFGQDGACAALFCLMQSHPLSRPCHVRRVERLYDFGQISQAGHTIAFTSTSTARQFLKAYGDKDGIVLLEADLPKGTYAIDLSAVLPHYAKAEEAEILLAPWLGVKMVEKQMDENEKGILDRNGNPPSGLYQMEVSKISLPQDEAVSVQEELIEPSIRVYDALNEGRKPLTSEIKAYVQLKKQLRTQCARAWENCCHQKCKS